METDGRVEMECKIFERLSESLLKNTSVKNPSIRYLPLIQGWVAEAAGLEEF